MKDKSVEIDKVKIEPDIELESWRNGYYADIGVCKYTNKHKLINIILKRHCKDERTSDCHKCRHYYGNLNSYEDKEYEMDKSYYESIAPVG